MSGLEVASRVLFIVLAMLAFAHYARAVVVPMLLAWVLSMALKPLVRWLNRWHLPLPVASALVVTSLVVGAGLGGVYMVRPAVKWIALAPDNLPRLKEKFRYVLHPAARLSEAATRVGNLAAEEGVPRMPTVELKDHRVAKSLHLVEANAVTPMLLGRRFALNPVVIFITLIACASLWGPVGALLAVPMLITLKVIGDRIPSLGPLAELLAPHAGTEVPVPPGSATTALPGQTASTETSTGAGASASE